MIDLLISPPASGQFRKRELITLAGADVRNESGTNTEDERMMGRSARIDAASTEAKDETTLITTEKPVASVSYGCRSDILRPKPKRNQN